MRAIAIILGLFWSVIFGVLVVLFSYWTEIPFQSVGVFFILPLGSTVIGMVSTSVYLGFLRLWNIPTSRSDYLIGLGFTFLTALVIYEIYYLGTDGGGISANFIDFMINEISTRQLTFSIQDQTIGTTPENAAIGWADFGIESLGYLFGSLGAVKLLVDKGFCKDCKKYFQEEELQSVDMMKDGKKALLSARKCLEERKKISKHFEKKKNSDGKMTVAFSKNACPDCHFGLFITKFYVVQKDGSRKAIDKLNQHVVIVDDKFHRGAYLNIDMISALAEAFSGHDEK